MELHEAPISGQWLWAINPQLARSLYGITTPHPLDDLAAKQEHLEPEFEKVLYDNLWDLYIR